MALNTKKGAGILHCMDQEDFPEVIKISAIYVVNGSVVVFKGECFTTLYHLHVHFHSSKS